MAVKKIEVHPRYNSFSLASGQDISIIRTVEDIEFSPIASAACLPSFRNLSITDGKTLKISGWGYINRTSEYHIEEGPFLKVIENSVLEFHEKLLNLIKRKKLNIKG